MSERGSVLTRVRRPEYTGENRCVPCTVLNVVIGGVTATGLALAALGVGWSGSVAVGGGLSAFGLSLVAIYLRGYLVPGTPVITRRYLPERVLERFGKASDDRPAIDAIDGEELVSFLSDADVLTESGDTAALTGSFRNRALDRVEESDVDAADVRALLDADAVSALGPTSFEVDGEGIERWVSPAAVAMDVAMAAELESRIDGWTDLDREERRDVLTGLRLQATRCPSCGNQTGRTVERLDHCCRRPHLAARTECRDCETIVADHVVPESAADAWIDLLGE